MFHTLTSKQLESVHISSVHLSVLYYEEIGLIHRSKRNPRGITKPNPEARKSNNLLERDFTVYKSITKYVTDTAEIKGKDEKLYVSAIFDCFDSAVLGLAMETSIKATLCQYTEKVSHSRIPSKLEAFSQHPDILTVSTYITLPCIAGESNVLLISVC